MAWQMRYLEEVNKICQKRLKSCILPGLRGANLNSAGTEGVISVLKKVEDIDGNEFIRVSGGAYTECWVINKVQ